MGNEPPWTADKPASKKVTFWSYSRYAGYDKCPAQFKYKNIEKRPEPPSPAVDRGNAIHKLAEDFTLGNIKKMPNELKLYRAEFIELKKSKPLVEQTWAFTKSWGKTVYNDWQNCWLRVKTDAAVVEGDTLDVIDHKTGKKYDDNKEQLSLYALGGFRWFPGIKFIRTHLWYLDSGDYEGAEFEAEQAPGLANDWEKKTRPMFNDTTFAPKPGNHCRWCAFSKSKGGPCKY